MVESGEIDERKIVTNALAKEYLKTIVNKLNENKKTLEIDDQGQVKIREGLVGDVTIDMLKIINDLLEALAKEKADRWYNEHLKDSS